ncbi:uncharacterized protein LOC106763377 [Vigna radiata var. radiata]|uniref:Uncharacterized protein LOC106763377 n=1 Tax=Vigna radiata var. radiata TaxID=3916 RepID=A0A1S3UAL6_VIGRR|nr:uncharacterized protein LOC106763377 [Vigna radiata var. radiata]
MNGEKFDVELAEDVVSTVCSEDTGALKVRVARLAPFCTNNIGARLLKIKKPWLHDQEDRNKRTITDLYKAITSEDTNTMHRLLAPDLEWWFHGPPSHRHHLIPHLTATTTSSSSSKPVLVPDLIVGFGSVTIAEGFDETNLVWWVHAWTTTADGVITEIREYVNTSVTVTRLGFHGSDDVVASAMCTSVWQSKLCDESVPGLILAI